MGIPFDFHTASLVQGGKTKEEREEEARAPNGLHVNAPFTPSTPESRARRAAAGLPVVTAANGPLMPRPPPAALYGQGGSGPGLEGYRTRWGSNIGQSAQNAQAAVGASGDWRNQQNALANELRGNNPSVAEKQLRMGQDAAFAQQLAVAHGNRTNGALGMRNAQANMGQISAQTNAQAGVLRAQEDAQRRGELGNLLNNARNSELGLAGLSQQREMGYLDALTGAERTDAELTQRGAEARQQGHFQERQQELQLYGMQVGSAEARSAAWQQYAAAGLTAAGTIAVAASDRRVKKHIGDGSRDARAFLDAIKPKRFEYKGESTGRLGVVAQDLEKAPMGEGIVHDTPGGKMIDAGQGVGALLASVSEINTRLKALEAKKGGKRGT